MATNFVSAAVSAGDDILASQYNNLRADTIANAGDYEDAGGSSNAYTLAIDSTITALSAGQVFKFRANHTNTDVATLNVNSIGAVSLKKYNDQTLLPGDIESGQIVVVVYDGTDFQIISCTQIAAQLMPTYQSIDAVAAPSADFDQAQIAISPDGTKLFFGYINGTTDGVVVKSYTIDQKTGLLTFSASVSLAVGTYNWSGSKGFGLSVSDSYVWACGGDGVNTVIVRLTHALASPTIMTISGTASTAVFCGAAAQSDDTVLYLKNQTTANNILTYTISGTTATRSTDVTLSAATTAGTLFFDDTSFYMMDEGNNTLRRYNSSGTLQSSTSGLFSLGTDDYNIGFGAGSLEITDKHRVGISKHRGYLVIALAINNNETTHDAIWIDLYIAGDV